MTDLVTNPAALIGIACLLTFAAYRLKRAARWVDATLQNPHPATAPTPTATTDPKKETTTRWETTTR